MEAEVETFHGTPLYHWLMTCYDMLRRAGSSHEMLQAKLMMSQCNYIITINVMMSWCNNFITINVMMMTINVMMTTNVMISWRNNIIHDNYIVITWCNDMKEWCNNIIHHNYIVITWCNDMITFACSISCDKQEMLQAKEQVSQLNSQCGTFTSRGQRTCSSQEAKELVYHKSWPLVYHIELAYLFLLLCVAVCCSVWPLVYHIELAYLFFCPLFITRESRQKNK